MTGTRRESTTGGWRRVADRIRYPDYSPIDEGCGIDGRLELFAGLRAKDYRLLRRQLSRLDAPEGKVLGYQGEIAREFIVVIEGQVAVTVDGTPIGVLDRGSHIGEVALLGRHDHRRAATWHTLTPSRLAVANRREFRTILDHVPVVRDRVLALAELRQAYLQGQRDGSTWVFSLDAEDAYPAHLATA